MISSRRANLVAIAICALLCTLGGLAIAQSIPSATKPTVALSPKKINFGKQPAGVPSQPKTVTLTNKGSGDLPAPSVTVTGTGFSLGTNGCISTIPPSGSCPVSVVFTPPRKGKFKHGLLNFTDGGSKSPQKVKLTGVGLAAPSPTSSPTATATPSPTATRTATATATTTRTATATISATPTASVTATATKTATPTVSATATATHTATPSVSATPTATASPVFNVVFVTSAVYDGSINGTNGLAGADSKCAALATSAGLPTGTYKAWLSTSTVNAVDRLGTARGFVRTDGSPFADRVSDIVSGKILHPLSLDETGSDINVGLFQYTWTGTTNAGTVHGTSTCVDWTSISGTKFGENGVASGGPNAWSDRSGALSCSDAFQGHLYCFDTTHISTLTVIPASGRVAFVSKASFDTTKGVPGADALCQSEAAVAGLTNPTHFLALLSTSTASAASRFDLSALSMPYVRPDGIKIADAATIASGTDLDSGFWQHADGSYIGAFTFAWNGSATPNATGTDNCTDWTTSSDMVTGIEGRTNQTDPSWWNYFDMSSCASQNSLYCLEQ